MKTTITLSKAEKTLVQKVNKTDSDKLNLINWAMKYNLRPSVIEILNKLCLTKKN
jgi:hypothetical protein